MKEVQFNNQCTVCGNTLLIGRSVYIEMNRLFCTEECAEYYIDRKYSEKIDQDEIDAEKQAFNEYE